MAGLILLSHFHLLIRVLLSTAEQILLIYIFVVNGNHNIRKCQKVRVLKNPLSIILGFSPILKISMLYPWVVIMFLNFCCPKL